MASLFTRIIRGEIPCHKVYEDELYFAFLDINPINPGHTLLVPKTEVDYLFDLDDDILGGLLVAAKPLVKVIGQVVECRRVGVLVAGLEVPHAHVHLVPITGEGELSFAQAQAADQDELAAIAERIRAKLDA